MLECVALINPSPPLHQAAYSGNLGAVELLLSTARRRAMPRPRNGSLHCMWLRSAGTGMCVKTLLDAGADARLRDKYGRTAADWAAAHGHAALTERLRAAEAVGSAVRL